jgi:hypothetical protein
VADLPTFEELTSSQRLAFCQRRMLQYERPGWAPSELFDRHAYAYWLGRTEIDRKLADWRLYKELKSLARQKFVRPWRWLALWQAWRYYRAVRRHSQALFYYGPGRTLTDLLVEVTAAGREHQL